MKPFDPTKITEGVRVDTSALRADRDVWRRVAVNEVARVTSQVPFVRRRITWWQRWRRLVAQTAVFVAGVLAGWVAATW